MPRIIAACIGLFGLANALAGFFRPELDANIWWIDLRGFAEGAARTTLLCLCGIIFAYALLPERLRCLRGWAIGATALLLAACVLNSAAYFTLLHRRSISATIPVPLSLLTALALLWIGLAIWNGSFSDRALSWRGAAAAWSLCLIGFPLAQIFLFGKTDYARPADAAIVFGARAYADGRPSVALYDRVRTACELHRRGIVKTLIFSGGPGDGEVHETEAMRALALQAGVPDSDIVLDRGGQNTRATLENASALLAKAHALRVLAVSHFYHLPRIKLESQRLGLEVWTVPARESYTLTKMPLLVAREVAAIWAYYLKV